MRDIKRQLSALSSQIIKLTRNNQLLYEILDGMVKVIPNLADEITVPVIGQLFPYRFKDITFDAAFFTGSGTIVWTVASTDIGTLEYSLANNIMTINFVINTTTVAGVGNELRIKIPVGRSPQREAWAFAYIVDNNVVSHGHITAIVGNNYIRIRRFDAANFAASANLTYVAGQISFRVKDDSI